LTISQSLVIRLLCNIYFAHLSLKLIS
jgi:hypothetical protein